MSGIIKTLLPKSTLNLYKPIEFTGIDIDQNGNVYASDKSARVIWFIDIKENKADYNGAKTSAGFKEYLIF